MKALGWIQVGAIGCAGLLGSVAGARGQGFSISGGFGGGHYDHHYGSRYHGPYRHYEPHYYGHHSPGFYGSSGVVIVQPPTRVVTVDRGYSNWEIVRDVQLELRRRGFYDGNVDGIFGPRTRDGLVAYQSRRGLPVTGAIDRETLGALGLD
jgi:hypothetical protein